MELLDDAEVAPIAAAGLKNPLLMFDFFNDVATKGQGCAMPCTSAQSGFRRVTGSSQKAEC